MEGNDMLKVDKLDVVVNVNVVLEEYGFVDEDFSENVKYSQKSFARQERDRRDSNEVKQGGLAMPACLDQSVGGLSRKQVIAV